MPAKIIILYMQQAFIVSNNNDKNKKADVDVGF